MPKDEQVQRLINKIDNQTDERITAMFACAERGWHLTTVILVCAAIDSMAWLRMPPKQREVEGKDFADWVQRYMVESDRRLREQVIVSGHPSLHVPRLLCSAQELWSARCGLVHTYTPVSGQVAGGTERPVYYVGGKVSAVEALEEIKPPLRAQCVLLHVGDLVEVFRQGYVFFKADIRADEDLFERVNRRSAHFIFGYDLA